MNLKGVVACQTTVSYLPLQDETFSLSGAREDVLCRGCCGVGGGAVCCV